MPDAEIRPADSHPRPPARARPICGNSCATRIRRSSMPIVNWYVSPSGRRQPRQCAADGQGRIARLSLQLFLDARRQAGRTTPSKGQSYLLSTMLGVTTGRGNTVDEMLAYLEAVGRSRRHPAPRHFLLHEEQRHPLADAAHLLRRRGARSSSGSVRRRWCCRACCPTVRRTCWAS